MSAADRPRGHEPARTYANQSIEVEWEPRLCIHSEHCVRGLGEVFNRDRRPWVQVEGVDADRIAATVSTCPTGALQFRRLDEGPGEEPPSQTTIEPQPNGPLFVRGRLRIVDGDGSVIREDTRVALCRCGASENKPFCDGSHRTVGFRTDAPAASAP